MNYCFYDDSVQLTDAKIVKREGEIYLEVAIKNDLGDIITIPRVSLDRARLQVSSAAAYSDEAQRATFTLDIVEHPIEGLYTIKKKRNPVTVESLIEELEHLIKTMKE